MRICRGCGRPVEKCSCSRQKKEQWLEKQYNEIFKKIDRLDGWEEQMKRCQEKMAGLQIKLSEMNEPGEYLQIDEKIWKICCTLEEKGYQLKERFFYGRNDIYDFPEFHFEMLYWFNFDQFPCKKGWSYDYDRKCLSLDMERVSEKYLKRMHLTAEQFIERQKDALILWAEALPPASEAEKGAEMPGLTKGHLVRQLP